MKFRFNWASCTSSGNFMMNFRKVLYQPSFYWFPFLTRQSRKDNNEYNSNKNNYSYCFYSPRTGCIHPCIPFAYILASPHENSAGGLSSILQIRKLKLREDKEFA